MEDTSPEHAPEHRSLASTDWATFLFLAIVWGASFFFIEIGSRAFHPGLVTWLRVLTGALVIWSFPGARGTAIALADRRTIVLLSFTATSIPFTLFPIAQASVSSAVAGLINGGVALMTALIGYLLFRRLPGRMQIVGLLVGALGVATIALLTAHEGTSEAIGVGLLIGAIVCYGVSLNLFGPLVARYGSVPVMARVLALSCLWTMPLGLWSLPGSRFAWSSFVAVAILGALGTGAAYSAMGRLINDVGSVRASYVTNVVPVVSLILGVAVLGEELPPAAFAGAVLVVAGAALVSRPRRAGVERTPAT